MEKVIQNRAKKTPKQEAAEKQESEEMAAPATPTTPATPVTVTDTSCLPLNINGAQITVSQSPQVASDSVIIIQPSMADANLASGAQDIALQLINQVEVFTFFSLPFMYKVELPFSFSRENP